MSCDKTVSLRVSDKQVADRKADEFLINLEREHHGLAIPRAEIEKNRKTIFEHLADHLSDLKARNLDGRGGRGAKTRKTRIEKVARECGWNLLREVSPGTFKQWRNSQRGLSGKTINHYLEEWNTFFRWLEKSGVIETNPLRLISKIDLRGQQKRERRALSSEELIRLISVSGPRGPIYLVAARTGIRQGELRRLEWRDVSLGSKHPSICVRAGSAKNKKEEFVPLHRDPLNALRILKPESAQDTELVFKDGVPRVERLKKDLAAAGIPYRDEAGRYVDFHSLRVTFGTFLQQNGVSIHEAKLLMRHSDIRLTTQVYLDEHMMPVHKAVASLPSLGVESVSHIASQNSGSTSQNVSSVGESEAPDFLPQQSEHEAFSVSVACSDVDGQMERVKGIEPS